MEHVISFFSKAQKQEYLNHYVNKTSKIPNGYNVIVGILCVIRSTSEEQMSVQGGWLGVLLASKRNFQLHPFIHPSPHESFTRQTENTKQEISLTCLPAFSSAQVEKKRNKKRRGKINVILSFTARQDESPKLKPVLRTDLLTPLCTYNTIQYVHRLKPRVCDPARPPPTLPLSSQPRPSP